jgi:UDP-3-O-[3-hydroxymyristoyl] glucosamine N-acyltransferase
MAKFLNLEHIGEEKKITGFDDIQSAGKSDVTFLSSLDKKRLKQTDAGVVICPPVETADYDCTILASEYPKAAFGKILQEYYQSKFSTSSVHSTAVIESGADIGANCAIGPNVYIADNVEVGDNCRIQSGVSIGEAGWSWGRDTKGNLPIIPHKAGVRIGDDVTIGSNTVIDRGLFTDTVVDSGSIIANLVHIAHQCQIGTSVIINQLSSIAGSVIIENHVKIQPCVAVATGVTIGNGSEIGMSSAVLNNIPSHTKAFGIPASIVNDDWTWWK